MGTTLYLIIFLLLQVFPLLAGEEKNQSREHLKKQILYAAPQGERSKTISLYRDYQKLLGRHDFEVLQALATLWIEQEARSPSVEKQLLALFAYDLCHLQVPTDLLENGLASTSPQVQRASLALIHKGQEDLADFLLNKAMSSSFLPIRLEAAFHMAHRKSPSVTGQLESLMHRLPAPLHYFFPEFFALIGTSDAVHVLRHLIDDPMPATRVEAILSAARHGRDDLLPSIRAAATHQDYAEQEAAAFALGQLRDSLSTKKLQKLAKSPTTSVQLAACYALYLLGQTQGVQVILQEAKQGNVFAMILLGEIPEQEQTLLPLLSDKNPRTRLHAAMALLKQRHPESLPVLLDFLIKDSKDLGFLPHISAGGALISWKVIPSLAQHAKESYFDMCAYTLFFKEELLRRAMELPEEDFLWLANKLFHAKQYDLVPTLIACLENIRTPGAIAMLQEQSKKAGAPFLRTYCQLALCRLGQGDVYKTAVRTFLKDHTAQELIQFRPSVPWDMQPSDIFHLTPEEKSSLLIQAYETLCEAQDEQIIDILLSSLEKGHSSNQSVLCGILLYALH